MVKREWDDGSDVGWLVCGIGGEEVRKQEFEGAPRENNWATATKSRSYVLFSDSVVGGLWEKSPEGQRAAEGTGFSGASGFLLMH